MLYTSHRTLKFLAAFVWIIGSIFLIVKGISLLFEADTLKPEFVLTWLSVLFGVFLGSFKAKYLFTKIFKKNLVRIASLQQPKIWQFYQMRFFVSLTLMITLGATLSKLAQGNYPLLIFVAILDLSIATALVSSSTFFWKYRNIS